MTIPSSMHETGHSVQEHWDNSEDWDGEGGGRGVWDRETRVHLWLIHVNVWQKPLQYCKVISLLLKFKKKEKNIIELLDDVINEEWVSHLIEFQLKQSNPVSAK